LDVDFHGLAGGNFDIHNVGCIEAGDRYVDPVLARH
jgi:hypothetical protein